MPLPIYPIARFAYNKSADTLSTFASDLGFRPGEWPTLIKIEGKARTATFALKTADLHNGELTAMKYENQITERGHNLTIYNI